MTDKQSYWISDADGNFALVEGVEARNWFTQVEGWAEADEPLGHNQVHVYNELPDHPNAGAPRLPYAVIGDMAGLGWRAGPPPGGPEPTAPDPAPAEPVKSTKAAAPAAGEKKE